MIRNDKKNMEINDTKNGSTLHLFTDNCWYIWLEPKLVSSMESRVRRSLERAWSWLHHGSKYEWLLGPQRESWTKWQRLAKSSSFWNEMPLENLGVSGRLARLSPVEIRGSIDEWDLERPSFIPTDCRPDRDEHIPWRKREAERRAAIFLNFWRWQRK